MVREILLRWRERLRHSWIFNVVVLPAIISLLCGLLVHLLTR